jgi:hypothetical protein
MRDDQRIRQPKEKRDLFWAALVFCCALGFLAASLAIWWVIARAGDYESAIQLYEWVPTTHEPIQYVPDQAIITTAPMQFPAPAEIPPNDQYSKP